METISKYWLNVGNSKKPCDTIHELQQPNSNPPVYVQCSDRMATTARQFYDDLQDIETFLEKSKVDRCTAENTVLETIHTQIPEDKEEVLEELLLYEEILVALKTAARGKATDWMAYHMNYGSCYIIDSLRMKMNLRGQILWRYSKWFLCH